MKLFLGILLICIGIIVAILTYVNMVVKKRFTMTGGGFNLMAFASILWMTGILLITNS